MHFRHVVTNQAAEHQNFAVFHHHGCTNFAFIGDDVRSFGATSGTVNLFLINDTVNIIGGTPTDTVGAGEFTNSTLGTINALALVIGGTNQGFVSLNGTNTKAHLFDTPGLASAQNLAIAIEFTQTGGVSLDASDAIVADFASFGFTDDGVQTS